MTNPAPPNHGPTCVGIDNGCTDCKAIEAYAREAQHRPFAAAYTGPQVHESTATTTTNGELSNRLAALEIEVGILKTLFGVLCRRVDELLPVGDSDCESAELPRPTPADVARWKANAEHLPGPLGRTLRIVFAEIQRLGAEGERQRRLLRRVACYAVVDPLGNPAAVCLPFAARMIALERDIDDCLEGRPERD